MMSSETSGIDMQYLYDIKTRCNEISEYYVNYRHIIKYQKNFGSLVLKNALFNDKGKGTRLSGKC